MISRVTVPTAMSLALQNSVAGMRNSPGAYGAHIRQAVQRGAGEKHIPSWNARLKHQTAARLISTGILPQ